MKTNEDFSAAISSRVDIEYPDFTKLSEPVRQKFESLPTKVNFFRMLMQGPMIGPGGKEIPPTGKSFEVDFCTVARRDNGEIVEETLFYGVVGLMTQIGVGK